jgi:hypothetical protein
MRCLVTKVYGNKLELMNLETRELYECDNPGVYVTEGRTVVEVSGDRLIVISD